MIPCRPYITSLTPVRIFLLLGTVFGMIWSVVTPPFQAPDEDIHFCRAYQLADGDLLPLTAGGTQGGCLPLSVIETITRVNPGLRYHSRDQRQDPGRILHYLQRPLEPGKTRFFAFPSGAFYPPAAYLPHVAAIWTGRLIGCSPLVMMYLGRWFTLLLWLLLVRAAIKITPTGRWIFMAVALMPMSLFIGASFNQDAVTNGLAFFTLAWLLDLSRKPGLLTRGQLALFALLVAAFALAKPGFALFALLFFLLPRAKARSQRAYLATGGLLLAAGYAAGLVWYNLAGSDLNWNAPFAGYEAQVAALLDNPLLFIRALLRSLWSYKFFYLRSHLGQLGSLDVVLPLHVLLPVLATLAVTACFNKGLLLAARQKAVLALVFLGLLVQAFLALYLTASPVAGPYCHGFQGRYLISVAPMFWLLWQNRLQGLGRRWRELAGPALFVLYLVVLSLATRVLFLRYY